ncbi:hypothetical protein QUF64_01760 [Anaerolineales bacterium HSG6]|nr:hypothetical protein [Anaerolineales bacterium HSG6]
MKYLTPTLIVIICSLIYVGVVLGMNQLDPMSFVLLGTQYSEADPNGTEGYDGQFAYQIALNPTQAVPYLDVPAYRYQRLLYPMLARWLALGQADLIPWTLILVNLLAIGWGTWMTEKLLVDLRVSRWYALSYGLYGGQMLTLRTDLNEPLAQALIQTAMWLWVKQRVWGTVLAFALAAFAKETSLIFLGAYIFSCLLQKEWRNSIKLSLAVVPFLGYQGLLWIWLGSFGLGSGGAGATPFSPIPLWGWLSIISVSVVGFLLISLVVFPMSILPALAGVRLSLPHLRAKQWHSYIISLFLHSLILLCLPASTMREPAAMMRLTQGLMVAMLLYGAWVKSPRILRYTTLWIFTNALLIGGVA